MSAKEAKKNKSNAPVPPPPTASAVPAATPAWIDDASNPRRQLIAKVVLAAVCIYVAMIWLLALDQTFHWGIFKP